MLLTKEIKQVQKNLADNDEDRMAFVFEALGDPTRLKIFRLLASHKDLCVTDIANVLQISVPAVSYQLKTFEMVGLVRKERMGKMICYELKKDDPLIKSIINIIT
ncbi:MAG TPA: metalloregulator ArsR/SmtB family transcription factor [Candidatus Paceibacterota bacterium]